jgi:hypothetical protein
MGSPTVVKTIPQPLNGTEIKRGIAVRMTQGLPEDVAEALREQIIAGLGKTCSLLPSSAYAKFKATWTLQYWSMKGKVSARWWVHYELDDFGRVTRGGIGDKTMDSPDYAIFSEGVIDEVPPDRFRRETDQPIPKPTELKPPEPEKSSMSHAARGKGRGRTV